MEDLSRRTFLAQLGLTLTAASVLPDFPAVAGKAAGILHPTAGKKLNIALCGLGNYAGALAEGLMASQYCRLAGLVTGHPAKAHEWRLKYGIPEKNVYSYENFDSIARNPDIDAVYIVLPNGLHKEFTIRAAKAGKHVICEKPMAISVNECLEMITACKLAGVQLAIGYRLHFEPTHLEIKHFGQDRVFGQVRMIDASLSYQTYDLTKAEKTTFNINDDAEWRLRKTMAGGGPLMDLGIYCIQASRYVLGEEPLSVTAQFGPVHNKVRFSQVEESISWQMVFPGGAVSTCMTSCGFNIDRFYAAADEGYFELSPALSYGPFEGKSSRGPIKFKVINQQAAQLDHIGASILAGEKLPDHITGKEGLKDLRVIEAIYEAARSGKKIQVSA